ncbi:hypothetical protein BHM03_00060707 [Ensete ventricosum]|nr:hypothetical protein BHM03_00060707 [Ensete ventricosum]
MAAACMAMAARGKMVYELYRTTTHVAGPIIFAHIQWRRLRGLEHPTRWPERFGRPSSPRPPGPLLWFHAVSLGTAFLPSTMARSVFRYSHLTMTSIPLRRRIGRDPYDQALCSCASQFRRLDDEHNDIGFVRTAIDFLKCTGIITTVCTGYCSEVIKDQLPDGVIYQIPVALLNARMSCKSFKRWSRTFALPLISLMLSKISLIAPLVWTSLRLFDASICFL